MLSKSGARVHAGSQAIGCGVSLLPDPPTDRPRVSERAAVPDSANQAPELSGNHRQIDVTITIGRRNYSRDESNRAERRTIDAEHSSHFRLSEIARVHALHPLFTPLLPIQHSTAGRLSVHRPPRLGSTRQRLRARLGKPRRRGSGSGRRVVGCVISPGATAAPHSGHWKQPRDAAKARAVPVARSGQAAACSQARQAAAPAAAKGRQGGRGCLSLQSFPCLRGTMRLGQTPLQVPPCISTSFVPVRRALLLWEQTRIH